MHYILHRNAVIARADSFEQAKDKVFVMGYQLLEDDPDYAECADAFLNDGRVIAIQPADFDIATAKPPQKGFADRMTEAWERGKKLAEERRAAMESFNAEFGIRG